MDLTAFGLYALNVRTNISSRSVNRAYFYAVPYLILPFPILFNNRGEGIHSRGGGGGGAFIDNFYLLRGSSFEGAFNKKGGVYSKHYGKQYLIVETSPL